MYSSSPAPATSACTSSSPSPVDSYVGSFISLTSKYEIRYEGVLYYLNPQDSTLGLQNVRSYGTEGRKKDGPQIPPSDKVYEYIMFRGSDIKDLQVKSSPPAQKEEYVHNDPAIIQSHSWVDPSSSSKPVSVGGRSLTQFNSYQESPALVNTANPGTLPSYPVSIGGGSLTQFSSYQESSALASTAYPGTVPSYQSGTPMGPGVPLQATQNANVASFPTPLYWPGYNETLSNNPYAPQYPNPLMPKSTSVTSLPVTVQNYLQPSATPASLNMGLTYSSDVAPSCSLNSSNSVHSNITPNLTPEHHPASSSMPSFFPLQASLPSHPALLTANRLTKSPFPSSSQDMNAIEVPIFGKAGYDSVTGLSVQSLPCSASSATDSTLGPLLKARPTLLTPSQLAQPRPPLLSSRQNPYEDEKDMLALNLASLNLSSSNTTPAVQPPLLPLPRSSQQYTEEFDFEAMNEKFNKDEVWGYLGGAKQGDEVDGIEEDTFGQILAHEGGYGSAPRLDPKPAYNKDEFFDTISCNSLTRGPINGQNRFSDRMKLDTETFGNFHRRPYQGYGPGRGENYRRSHYLGRAYNYGGRGSGGNFRI